MSSRSMVSVAWHCLAVVAAAAVLIGVAPVKTRKEGKQSIGYYKLRRDEFSIVVINWGATILSVNLHDKKDD
ncbi:hypothetical protein ABZP36_005564 [Zizania latifolia]